MRLSSRLPQRAIRSLRPPGFSLTEPPCRPLFLALITLAACLALSLPLHAAQTIVHLKNGDRLSGQTVSRDDRQLILETALGRLTIPLDAIARLEEQKEPPQPVSPPTAFTNAWYDLQQQYLAGRVSPEEFHHRRAQLLQIARESGVSPAASTPPPKPPVPTVSGPLASAPSTKVHWGGEAQIGTDLGFGTKDRQAVSGRVKLTTAWQRLRNQADYLFLYGHSDGELSANRMDGIMKTDWSLSRPLYVYNLGSAGYDEVRAIDLKYEVGPGLGWHLVQGPKFGLSAEFGGNYYTEIRDADSDRENFYFRFAEILTWKITPRISLDEKLEIMPQVEEPDVYRYRFEANMRYALNGRMSLILTVIDQYESTPPSGVDHSDVQVRSSLGVKF